MHRFIRILLVACATISSGVATAQMTAEEEGKIKELFRIAKNNGSMYNLGMRCGYETEAAGFRRRFEATQKEIGITDTIVHKYMVKAFTEAPRLICPKGQAAKGELRKALVEGWR